MKNILQLHSKNGELLCVSSISCAEVLAYESLTEKDIEETRKFLAPFLSITFDDQLADQAGYIRRAYKLKFPDAGIAATASVFRVPLLTRDRQMKKVKEIEVIAV